MIDTDFSFKDKMNDIKDDIFKSNKYWITCIVLILISFFAVMGVENYTEPQMEIAVLAVTCILSVFSICFYQGHRDDKNFYKTAFIVILLFGIVFSILTPIMCTHDETEHFVRAEITSNGVLIPEYNNTPFMLEGIRYDGSYQTIQSTYDLTQEGKIKCFITSEMVSSAYFNNNRSQIDKASDYIRVDLENSSIFKTDADTQPINTTPVPFHSAFTQNPFFGYVAPAIGIAIAKFLDLNAIWMLWLGRIFNVALYAGLVAYAIKKTPILKVPMFVVACIPAAMSQAASVSIDPIINGLAIVVISYFLYLYKSPDSSLDHKDIIKFSVLVMMLSLCKVTYAAFIFLLLFLPRVKFRDRKYYYFIGLIIIVFIAILGLWSRFYVNPGLENSWRYSLYLKKNHVDALSQLGYMMDHKKETVITILHLFSDLNRDLQLQSFFGTKFSSLSLIFLGSVFFLYPHEKIYQKTKIGALLVFCIIYFGTYILFMLTWYPFGNLSHAGVQSRYFFPIFALMPIFLGFNRFEGNIDVIDSYIIMLTVAFMAFRIITMTVMVY